MKKIFFGAAFFSIIVLAGLFRGMDLAHRPMHHDEANQAVKFGSLLEEGIYRYDPMDHHGPSLYYLTLPIAWAAADHSFAEVNENLVRAVPAFFGVALIAFLLLFGRGMSPGAKLAAAVLTALSPIMVFFSRFYIQEMILAAFLIGLLASVWRWLDKASLGWAFLSGIFAGFMYATKETSLILFLALAAALLLTFVMDKKRELHLRPKALHLAVFSGTAFLIAVLLFSSFFQNLRGPLDSLLTYRSYFDKASAPGWHIHPWFYYLHMLTYWKLDSGPVWSEALVLGLGLVGMITALRGRSRPVAHPSLARFMCFFTLAATLIYSAVPYKTPWNAIPFYTGFLWLAGLGAAVLVRMPSKSWLKGLVILVLAAGIFNLGIQSRRGISTYDSDPRNPYVYAQTSRDFLNMVKRIKDIAFLDADGQNLLIKVFAGPYETWPLPWYLRGFGQVGYWTEAKDPENLSGVPVIVASMDLLEKIAPHIETSHLSEFYGLRPDVLISLHIRKDLWEKYLETRICP